MLFICGVDSGQKTLAFHQLVVCQRCGSYGRYQVFMNYMCLSLFFIPVLKWGRRYYVRMSCCDALYELDGEVGRRIARGEALEIQPSELTLLHEGNRYNQGWNAGQAGTRRCGNCGYETAEDFKYCPKCGQKF